MMQLMYLIFPVRHNITQVGFSGNDLVNSIDMCLFEPTRQWMLFSPSPLSPPIGYLKENIQHIEFIRKRSRFQSSLEEQLEKVFFIGPKSPNVAWTVQLINKSRQCESLNSRAALASGFISKCPVSNVLYGILNLKSEQECNLLPQSDSSFIIYRLLAWSQCSSGRQIWWSGDSTSRTVDNSLFRVESWLCFHSINGFTHN